MRSLPFRHTADTPAKSVTRDDKRAVPHFREGAQYVHEQLPDPRFCVHFCR